MTLEPPAFWLGLKQITDANERPKFDVLCDLMCSLLALPHSSACVERVFSQMNLLKTKQTNRLLGETLSNRMLAKQAVSKRGVCHSWKPSKLLLEDMHEGRCRQRYIARLQQGKLNSTVTAHDIDEEEVVDVDISVDNFHA